MNKPCIHIVQVCQNESLESSLVKFKTVWKKKKKNDNLLSFPNRIKPKYKATVTADMFLFSLDNKLAPQRLVNRCCHLISVRIRGRVNACDWARSAELCWKFKTRRDKNDNQPCYFGNSVPGIYNAVRQHGAFSQQSCHGWDSVTGTRRPGSYLSVYTTIWIQEATCHDWFIV